MENNKSYNNQDIQSVLQYLYQNYGGNELFETKGKAVNLFINCASMQHLQAEFHVLKALDDSDGLERIAQASVQNGAVQKELLFSLRSKLTAEGVDEDAIVRFLQPLTEVLGWEYTDFLVDCLRQEDEQLRKVFPDRSALKNTNLKLEPDAKTATKPEPSQQAAPQSTQQQPAPKPITPSIEKSAVAPSAPKKKSWILLLVLLLILFGAVQSYFKKSSAPTAASSESAVSESTLQIASFTLPNVVGMDEKTAHEALAVGDLSIEVKYQYDLNTEDGIVIAQSPAAGTEWTGAAVELLVCDKSLGMATVPDVVGLSLPAAKETLEKAGFTTGVRLSGNETAVVTAQEPAGGASAVKGSNVTLSYERIAASEKEVETEPASKPAAAASSSASSASRTQPEETSKAPVQELQPTQAQSVQSTSASITKCNKNVIQFVTSGGSVSVSVEFVYPNGAHSSRFALGTFSDGTHEFSPGVSIADPEGTYQVYLYDASGNQLASSSFTN